MGGISIMKRSVFHFFIEVLIENFASISLKSFLKRKELYIKNIVLLRDKVFLQVNFWNTTFINKMKIDELKDWPSFIPYLNPIENIWGKIKKKDLEKKFWEKKLIKVIREDDNQISEDTIFNKKFNALSYIS